MRNTKIQYAAVKGATAAILLSLLLPCVASAQRRADLPVPAARKVPPTPERVRPVPPPLPPPDVHGKPGVINRTGDKPLDSRFDPKTLGRTKDLPRPEDQNVIEVKLNYVEKYPCKRIPLDSLVSIDFQNLKLEDFTKLMACMTGKRFMLAQGVSGNITIMSPEPVTMYEAWKAFLSALEANGLTIVKRGKFLRIVPKAKARTQGAPILSGRQRSPDVDTMVTQLISIKHIMADEAKELIQNFATDGADITVYQPTNTLILTEIASNIPRLRKLIAQVDRPTGAVKIWVRPVEFADAAEIGKMVESVFGKGNRSKSKSSRPSRPSSSRSRGKTGSKAKPATGGSLGSSEVELSVNPDERTNQLVIITDRATYLQIDRFIRKIDVPIPGEGQIHIHHLENADAKDVQSTLQALTGSGSSRGSSRRSSRKSKGKGKTSKSKSSGGTALIGDNVKITAHEPTNSLVIQANLKDYLTLRRVIRQLDIRRKQVYLESVIMEITSDKNRDVGIKGFGGLPFDIGGEEVPLIFGNGVPDISAITDAGGGLGAMLLGPLIDASLGTAGAVAGQSSLSIPAFGFTLRALQSNSDVNILQTPHILTTDNEEAEIEVGRRVPFNSGIGGLGGLGSLAGLSGLGLGGAAGGLSALGGLGGALGGLGGLGGGVQFVDVKLSLKIKPTVNESNFVRLEIEQTIDDFDGIDPATKAPNTSNRRVKNIVVVRDQQPVVIGGLMNDREVEASTKIPILGDIPLIGMFFRQTITRVERKNLLMIIIPHIIDDPSDLKRIHEQRLDEIRRFAEFLATRKKEYMGQINYDKKHGLLHQMHQVVERVRLERLQLEQQLFDDSELDPVGPAETHDLEYDPYEIELRRQTPRKDGRNRGGRGK